MNEEVLDAEMTKAENTSSPAVVIEKHRASYFFTGIDKETLATKVEEFLLGKGYKLETGNKFAGQYGKGNKLMRVLFGAFVKRFCWGIQIDEVGDRVKLRLAKDEKGYVGGVIGANQVKNEYASITTSLKNWHASMHS